MFIGHYGPAFAAKAVVKTVPLWVLFVAAQWVDFLWAAFVVAGVEKVRIVENFIGLNPLDLYYMPFTHGLPSAALLSLFIGGVVGLAFKADRVAVVLVVAATAFLHWLCDWIVHAPDLPLIFNDMKVGLGLWANPAVSVPLELGLLSLGVWLYDRAAPSPRRSGTVALWLLGVAMAALQVQDTYFGKHPGDPAGFATLALVGYSVLTLLAAGVDYLRRTR